MKTRKLVNKLRKELKKVKAYKEQMEQLTDQQLSGLTASFKERYSKGESLDKILPEAFAAMCEADKRVLGMYPFDVQIMAGIALHQGYLAEMGKVPGRRRRIHAGFLQRHTESSEAAGNGWNIRTEKCGLRQQQNTGMYAARFWKET